ncbi:hypothetical protein MJO29_003743 [Puccinia striiformis f. sp. tritici]|nr:hypothetical protein MJO29_003743 [Puccinia striiformis f. sp. tritici]
MPIELMTWITKDPTPAVFCQSSIPVIGRSHWLQFARSVVPIGRLHAFQLHDQKNSNLNNSTKNLLNHETNFYDDKRRSALHRDPKNITRPIVRQLDKEDREETMEKQPLHSKASIILDSFGPFIGRSKPCKRKIRQRNREDKVVKFLQKSSRPKIVFTLMQKNEIYTFPS